MFLQQVYKPILNLIYSKLTFRLGNKHRNAMIFLCFFAIFVVQFLEMYQDFGIVTAEVRSLFVCLATGLVIVFSVNGNCEILKWNKILNVTFLLVPVLLVVAGINHFIGTHWVYNAIVVIFEFTGLYYVWGNRKDYDTLFKMISYAYICFMMLIIAYCIIKYPYIEGYVEAKFGYTIMGINPNGFSKVLMPGIAAAMYLLIMTVGKKKQFALAAFAGIMACTLFLTESRNAILCTVAILVMGVILYYRQRKVEGYENCVCIKKLLCMVTIVVIAAVAMLGILNYVSPVLSKTFNPNILEYNEPSQMETSESESEPTYAVKTMRSTCELGKSVVGDNETLAKLNTLTSSRVYLWAAYLSKLSWTGTDEVLNSYGPHNIYIEYAYKAGILTGVIWLLFSIMAGIVSLYMAFKHKCTSFYFTLFAFIVYFTSTILDTGTLLLQRSFIFVYFVAIAPVFFQSMRKTTENIADGGSDEFERH